uniref:Uncharacterized protein n=1 Tax=Panagrolaimus davidi TaxID=227884 RepID=A0A914R2I7_9BILA
MDALPSSEISQISKKLEKIQWPNTPSMKQNWSFKESLIYYIAMKPPTSKVYQRLIQLCKYFFEKNPILIVTRLRDSKEDGDVKSRICFYEDLECYKKKRECCFKIDIAKLSAKIWITRLLFIINHLKDYFALLCSKLYRCENIEIGIFDTIVMFEDFKFMVSSAKDVALHNTSIEYNNGTIVMFDKILECLSPNVEMLEFTFSFDISIINDSTMANIIKLQNLGNLRHFHLHEFPESLEVKDLLAFIKKYENVKILLYFSSKISQRYKNQLDTMIDAVIKSNVPNHLFFYNGQDETKIDILMSRFTL